MATLNENWLSSVDLGTYHLTLYITTPELWTNPEPLKNDTRVGSECAIIAESGVTGGYSIDNVLLKSTLVGSSTTGGVATGIVQFDVHEPLAFKLLDRILSFGKVFNFPTMQSAKYVLKVEFKGRDSQTGRVTRFPGIYLMPLSVQQIDAHLTSQGTMYNFVAGTRTIVAQQEGVITQTVTVKEIQKFKDFASNLQSTLNDVYLPSIRGPNDSGPRPRYIIEIDQQGSRASFPTGSLEHILPFPSKVVNGLWAGVMQPMGLHMGAAPSTIEAIHEEIAPNTNLIEYIRDKVSKNVKAFIEWQDEEKAKQNPLMWVPVVRVVTDVRARPEIDGQTGEHAYDLVYIITAEKSFVSAMPPTVGEHANKLYNEGYQNARFDQLPIRKKYSYLYSGENTEVLDMELKFDYIFSMAKFPLDGKLYAQGTQESPGSEIYDGKQLAAPAATLNGFGGPSPIYVEDIEPKSGIQIETINYAYSHLNTAVRKVTETMDPDLTEKSINSIRAHELSNRMGNGIECQLTIKGDPFWLGTPGTFIDKVQSTVLVGNTLVSTQSNNADIAAVDSVTLSDYNFSGEMFIALTTYNPNDSFTIPNIEFSREMDMVSSGIYSIQTVESRFANGQFTQTLKGMRDRQTATAMVATKLDQL